MQPCFWCIVPYGRGTSGNSIPPALDELLSTELSSTEDSLLSTELSSMEEELSSTELSSMELSSTEEVSSSEDETLSSIELSSIELSSLEEVSSVDISSLDTLFSLLSGCMETLSDPIEEAGELLSETISSTELFSVEELFSVGFPKQATNAVKLLNSKRKTKFLTVCFIGG